MFAQYNQLYVLLSFNELFFPLYSGIMQTIVLLRQFKKEE